MNAQGSVQPSTLVEWLTCGYLMLIPVGWSPFPANIYWADLVFCVLVATLILTRRPVTLSFHPIDGLVLLYLGASLLSFTGGTFHAAQSWLEFAKQAYLGVVYVVMSLLGQDERLMRKMLVWCAWIAVLLAGATLVTWGGYRLTGFQWLPLLEVGPVPGAGDVARLKGALLSPAFFCSYLTFAVPIVIGLAMTSPSHKRPRPWPWSFIRKARWWWFGVAVVSLAAVGTVTYSVVGFMVAGLLSMWGVLAATRLGRVLRLGGAVLAAVLFVVLNGMLIASIRHITWVADNDAHVPSPAYVHGFQEEHAGARRITVGVSYNPMSYYLLKRIAWKAFLRRPVTGVGLGAFPRETERAYQEGRIHQPYHAADPHSEWLGRLAETGLVGAAALLGLWMGFLRLGKQLSQGPSAPPWLSRALVAGLIGLCISSINVDVMNFRFLWVGFAFLRSGMTATT